MTPVLSLLLLVSLMECVVADDSFDYEEYQRCILRATTQQMGCKKCVSTMTINLDNMTGCDKASLNWDYPSGTLNVTFTSSQSNLKLCITEGFGVQGDMAKMTTSSRRGVVTNVPFPTGDKPSCVTSSTKSMNLAFRANPQMAYMALVVFTFE